MGQGFSERYEVFGFYIESELILPELIIKNAAPDVHVKFGKITETIDKHSLSGICYKANLQKFLLRVDGVAQYLIENGNLITIDRSEGGSDEEIRLFLLGSAFGALFHQREMLPLHGSAIVFGNQALIFSGISGAGKSTLAAGFVKRGYKLLTDDVCIISVNSNGRPIVHPGYPQMKLWFDSLENLGHRTISSRKVYGYPKKVSLPIVTEFYNAPLPLKGVYVISKKDDEVVVREMSGSQRLKTIMGNIYKLNFLSGDVSSQMYEKHLKAISDHCFVKALVRPSKGFHISKLIEVVENDVDVDYSS